MTKSIQQILDEQRQQSEIHKVSNQKIAASHRKYDLQWQESQAKNPGRFQKGINNAIERMGGYDEWYKKHCEDMADLGKRRMESDDYKNLIGPKISAHWQNPEEYEAHCNALREGWNKPGVRERKSASQKASYQADPELLKKKQDVARRNGRSRARPCYSPEGIFEDCGAWAKVSGYSRDLFGYRARKMPDQYYYITKEEYTKLTGLDPWNE